MKLLWLGHFVPWPLTGGSLIRSFHLLREAAREHEVSFLGFNQSALLPEGEALEEARRVLQGFCARVEVLPLRSGGGSVRTALLVGRSLLSGSYDEVWLRSRRMQAALCHEIARSRPQLVHFDTVGLTPYADVCGALPLVLNHHNIESQMMRRRAEQEPGRIAARVLRVQAARLEVLERSTAARFARQLVVSALDAERLATIVPAARIDVVPNGVDLDYFRPDAPLRRPLPHTAVFLGGLNWYPNRSAVAWFVDRVLPLVRAQCPDFRLTIAGKLPPGDLLPRLRGEAALVLPGEVDDVRPYLAESALFVCPMLEGGGTRLKVLTAMASGVPMVATEMAVEGIGIRDGVHARLASDPAAFASAMLEVFRDGDLQARLAANALALVRSEFGWDSIGRRLQAAYARTLGTKTPCAASSRS